MKKAQVSVLAAALLIGACGPLRVAVPPGHVHRVLPGPAGTELWADSMLASMTLEQKVGQVVMVGAFGHYYSRDDEQYARLVHLVRDHGVGGLILWQSDALEAPSLLNELQREATVPLLVSADLERGPAMRVRRTTPMPDAMAIGATGNPEFAYIAGRITAEEGRALGIHQNYAPVGDVNTNALNPVINTRAFGDSPDLVRRMVTAYIRGTQDGGMVATVKHFPGHGDAGTDSHLALPVLAFGRERLDTVELSPFRAAVDTGVGSVMIAHLAAPALGGGAAPASMSPAIIGDVLGRELGFGGLVVTDALEMRGVTRGYSVSDAAVSAFLAGADILLMSPDTEVAITALIGASRDGTISPERLDRSVRKILAVKQELQLHRNRLVDTERIRSKVGTRPHRLVAKRIARNAITLLRNDEAILPLAPLSRHRVSVILLTDGAELRSEVHRTWSAGPTEPTGSYFLSLLRRRNGGVPSVGLSPASREREFKDALGMIRRSDVVVIGVFVRVRTSSGTIALPASLRSFVETVNTLPIPTVVVAFGSPYVAGQFPGASALVCAYGDSEPQVEAAVEALFGEIDVRGTLPVTVSSTYPAGSGRRLPHTTLRRDVLVQGDPDPAALRRLDDVLINAIRDSAFPGAQAAVVAKGALVYSRAFGTLMYDRSSREVSSSTLYDLASLTKVIATTAAVMKLVDTGRLGLDDRVGAHLPAFREGDKAGITVRHLLMHRSGFPPFRRFYQMCRDAREMLDSVYATPLVAFPGDSTIYSDIGMITLGKVVEAVTKVSLSSFVQKEFFEPLGMTNTMYSPSPALLPRIAPTELDTAWRRALVHGTVHDENAALLGGVSGHAGLFSTAEDLAVFMQMLMNGGVYGGRRYLGAALVHQFTRERAPGRERYLGWDSKSSHGSSAGKLFSTSSFGHTGFTGTSLWVDPEREICVILLSNRVHPTRANAKVFGVRPAFHDAVVRALQPERDSGAR